MHQRLRRFRERVAARRERARQRRAQADRLAQQHADEIEAALAKQRWLGPFRRQPPPPRGADEQRR